MRKLVTPVLLLALSAVLSAQGLSPLPGTVTPAPVKVHSLDRSWADFDHRQGRMSLTAGSEYVGASMALMMRNAGRLQYGLNLDMLPVEVSPNYANRYYDSYRSHSTLLVPVWFTVKMRLREDFSLPVSPYVIGGVGPTLALRFEGETGIVNTISQVEGTFGGGAFAGIGVDYLWAEEWAFSVDVRYNVIRLDTVLGRSDEYDGVSFFFGFIRAFGL